MDFYTQTGKMALGSRLRRLSELITEQAAAIYELYQVDFQPKWFPVFYCLSAEGDKAAHGEKSASGEKPTPGVKPTSGAKPAEAGMSITDIAREIGHTHPSVSQIVREMTAKGYVTEKKGEEDGRKNFVVLSDKGKAIREKMQPQLDDVGAAIERAMGETHHDLWRAIGEWEFLLEQKSLFRRVQEEKKTREIQQVQIIDCTPAYYQAFHDLNEQWITQYFKMEESDHHSLDHPEEYILHKGGHIFIALYKGTPVGTCALIPQPAGPAPNSASPEQPSLTQAKSPVSSPYATADSSRLTQPTRLPSPEHAAAHTSFELAKMAVSPTAQGLGIGWLLGQACIERARSLGVRRLYLESNTRLKPAISLYHKLGFRKVAGPPSPYERCDIQMELLF